MRVTSPLTWKSIVVLPALIVISALAVLLIAWSQQLSVHGGMGLLIAVLTVMEIGYLLVLIAMSRGDGPDLGIRSQRERWVRASPER